MGCLFNTLSIVGAYLLAGWMGYMIGVERGIAKCNTHRYPRRER